MRDVKTALIILFIFITAFSIRLAYIFTSQDTIETDEVEYNRMAISILNEGRYVSADGSVTSYRPPLYPVFIAAIYKIFDQNRLAVRVIQAVIASLTVCLIYLTACRIFNRQTALIAGIFSVFYATFVICAKLLYSETLFSFLLVLIIYLTIAAKRRGLVLFSALGFLCGFLTLVKATGLFVPFIIIFLSAIEVKRRRLSLKRFIKVSAVLLISFASFVLPWTARNYKAYGKFVLISTNGGINMYQGLCKPEKGMIFTFPPGSPMSVKYDTITDEVERNNFFARETLKIYRTKPFYALKMFVIRFLFFWNIIDWEIIGGDIINFQYVFILPFAFLGTFLALKSNKEIESILLVILYFASFTLFFPGFSRYRMPIDGYIIILGSYGIYRLMSNVKYRLYSALSISAYFLFTYFLYKFSSETKYFVKTLMQRIGLW
ncbi:MAG: glycosyltransferase family 39 protein [Candidatus Omnitrophica bacterium]|nr:glycosyltransferase family 39 protein [Candidatus Omnitrophota bacterium]